jgi:hypothetical protein
LLQREGKDTDFMNKWPAYRLTLGQQRARAFAVAAQGLHSSEFVHRRVEAARYIVFCSGKHFA